MFPSLHNRLPYLSTLLFLALGLVPLVIGCAPVRGDDDDDDGPSGNTLSHALFTVIDYGDSQSNQSGRLVLVDSNVLCEELNWGGGLNWWDLSSDVEWLELYLTRGLEVDGWTQQFQSSYSWGQEGGNDYSTATFFSGQSGTGGTSSGGDDDDIVDPPPPADPREVSGQIGGNADQADDSLTINSYSLEARVSGYLQSTVGNYSFSATHCGITEDNIVVGDNDDEPAADDAPIAG